MRKIIAILVFFVPSFAFAIACTNGRILDTGYSIQQVLQYCGNPYQQKSYPRTVRLVEEWTYYKNGVNNTNTRIKFLLTDNQITNINVQQNGFEQNLQSSNACGSLLQTGQTSGNVLWACGDSVTKQTLENIQDQVTELIYLGVGNRVLVFNNDRLVDWKYAE